MDKELLKAFIKVKGQNDGVSRIYLAQCLDLGDSWAFTFSDEPVTKDTVLMGVVYGIVNKKTGKVTHEPFVRNPEKFINATKIDVKQFKGL